MTDDNYTALILIIDRSGSMHPLAQTTQEALEELVHGQKLEPGKLTIDTVFFDDHYEERAALVDPAKESLDLSIQARGMTALYDAVGRKVTTFGETLARLPEAERPGKVIVVIATDGHENSSTEYTSAAVAAIIKEQQETYGWKFTFVGANQDAVLTARHLNIAEEDAITFAASAGGTESVLRSVGDYVSNTRSGVAFAGYSAADRSAAMDSSPAGPPTPAAVPLVTGAPGLGQPKAKPRTKAGASQKAQK
jgi:hypothetical protein